MDAAPPGSIDRSHYPESIATVGQIAPAPRRVRGVLDSAVVFDTLRAIYVWEVPYYPQYYVPVEDVDAADRAGGDP